ncbi:hypothetical protein V6N00_12980 [Tersicoccus sp. MR15.9]|uniref:hypothetical protein n=1 Tax=Tersicoccus mangrovi TaxID=3121635 RepID=UPI002FE54792
MSLDLIRRTYAVPARRGARVRYTGGATPIEGTITGTVAGTAHLRVRLDGQRKPIVLHPVWALEYLTTDSPKETPIMPAPSPSTPPEADSTLAALAVLDRFAVRDFDALNVLLDTTDGQQLIRGLLNTSLALLDMTSIAANTTHQQTIAHLREQFLGLVAAGQMSADPGTPA